jgi:hypothetical protein
VNIVDSTSEFQLWLMGILWGLGPSLGLSLAAILGLVGFRHLHRAARSIERRPTDPGVRGFVRLIRDGLIHTSLTRLVVYLLIGCVMLGGLISALIQAEVRRHAGERALAVIESNPPPSPMVGPVPNGDAVLDWIILSGIVFAIATVIFGVRTYRVLTRRAAQRALRAGASQDRSTLVRLFHKNRKLGMLVLGLGGWFLWGFSMQIVGGLVLTVPGMSSLPAIPGAETAAILFLVVLGLVFLFMFLAPMAWFSWRSTKLHIRYVRENRIAHAALHINLAIIAGFFGSILSMELTRLLGRIIWPSLFH